MADYNVLKQAIQAVIRTNGNEEITGQVMQDTLLRAVNVLGAFALYRGVANTSTNPGTPDQRVFYFASEQGTYVNFNNFVLSGNRLAVLHNNNGTWQGDILMTLSGSITPISIDNALSTVSTNPVENRAIATEIQSLWATVNSIPTTPLACKKNTINNATELTGNTFADKIIVGFRVLTTGANAHLYTTAFQTTYEDNGVTYNRLYIFGFNKGNYWHPDSITLTDTETFKDAIGVSVGLEGSIEVMYLDDASTYDLTTINAAIARFTAFLDNTDSADPSINTWKDMENFMGGVSDTDTFLGKLADLKAELQTLINAKQNKLTFDAAPTINSTNPVTSGGVYSALQSIPTNALRQISDFAQYSGTDGEIVQYVGTTTANYINGYTYKNVGGVWTQHDNQPAKVANGDGFLQVQNETEIASVISIEYNSNNNHLELKGVGGAVVSYVDMDGIYDGADIVLSNNYVIANSYVSPQAGETLDVVVGKLAYGLSTKEDALTFDDVPTAGSDNPVKSGGIKTAIDNAATIANGNLKQRDLTQYSGTDGEIVQHTGTDGTYKNGYVYKYDELPSDYPPDTLSVRLNGAITNRDSNPIDAAALIGNDRNYIKTTPTPCLAGNEATWFQLTDRTTPTVGDGVVVVAGGTFNYGVITEIEESSTKYYCTIQIGENSVNYNLTKASTLPTKCTFVNNSGQIIISRFAQVNEEYILDNPTISVEGTYFVVDNDNAYPIVAEEDWMGNSNLLPTQSAWTQHDTQPSSSADVASLQQRMTAAETAISGKENTITGAASTITANNLTASKVLTSDANGKVAATSIATADAEDAVSKRHTQNTDTQIVSGANSVVVNGSGATINGNGSVTGNLSVSGNLNVTGKETVEEIVNIKSENNFITLRDGAQTAIASGSLSGTKVENYDGLNNNLLFGTDASGVFRIGDEGGTLEPLLTREEDADLTDGDVLTYDKPNMRAEGVTFKKLFGDYVSAEVMTEAAYQLLVDGGNVDADTVYFTYEN